MYISLFACVFVYIYVCVDVDIHMYKMACIYIIGPSVCKRGRQYQQTFFPANILNLWQRSRDGFMQWEEFLELQQCLVAWYHVFCQHDADRSGFIDSSELYRVIQQLFGNLTLVLLNNNTQQRMIYGKDSHKMKYDWTLMCIYVYPYSYVHRHTYGLKGWKVEEEWRERE